MFNDLCLDVRNEIISNLDRKELYYLSMTSKFYHNFVQFNKLIINTIKQRLKNEFGEHYDSMTQLMKRNNVFLSGSFIIQCILDEDWTSYTNQHLDSDINFFQSRVNHNVRKRYDGEIYVSDIENYIYDIMFYKDSVELYNIPFTTHHPILYHIIQDVYYFHDIDQAKKVIQMTTLDTDEYYKFICNRVDFDICKNIYYNDKLIINDIDAILNKQIIFKNTFNTCLQVMSNITFKNGI